MRILFISNLYPPQVFGGYEILCSQVANELADRGHEVVVLTSAGLDDPGFRRERVIRRLELATPFNEPANHSRSNRLATDRTNEAITLDVLETVRPDVVFVWSQLRLSLGPARAAEQAGYPVLYTLNDEHLEGYLPVPPAADARRIAGWIADRTYFRRATTEGLRLENTVAISRRVRDNLVTAGVPVEGARVVYQGIPIERFPMKREPGSLGTPTRLLYVGQLHRYKGVHTVLHALDLLASEHRVRLTIVGAGDDEYREYLQTFAHQRHLNVAFLGKQPHYRLSSIYQEHDMFVFPSIWSEPFGLTHLEAMASGVPVVSTANGGQGEFLRDGVNALVFDPEDAEGLACRLASLIVDDSLRRRIALGGRRLVEREFTLTRYVTDLEQLLAQCALARRAA